MLKSRKATRGSPYGGGRQHSKLDSSNYEESMLGGDEDASDSWVAEKHVGLKIDRSSKEPKHGIKLQTHPTLGVIVSGLNPAGQAARNGLNVGDQLRAIDGEQVKSHVAAMQVLDMAVEGRRLTLTASGLNTCGDARQDHGRSWHDVLQPGAHDARRAAQAHQQGLAGRCGGNLLR